MNACANSLHVGDVAHLTCKLVNVASGLPANPTTISVAVTDPYGGTTYNAPTQDGTGLYSFDQPLNAAGSWSFVWRSTGQNQAVAAGGFYVETI